MTMAAPNGHLAASHNTPHSNGERVTRVLPVHSLSSRLTNGNLQQEWAKEVREDTAESRAFIEAADALRTSDVPVSFPTETVYGLGADATRSSAVQGIYKAKQRPSDNPLIVHVWSREQLENLIRPHASPNPRSGGSESNGLQQATGGSEPGRIPAIYEPLIARFWPGPLTILLPNPAHFPLAPEVTSTLSTFGVRMPSSPLARLLIHLADRPLAAPSANASTKPSPTTAQHVFTDLNGRIDIILDGGPSGVGVESTVVDGLSQPPSILRPGGIGIDEIRACPGWEDVQVGYKDGALQAKTAPRAPGMKYRHYSPKAKVVLFEASQDTSSATRRVQKDLSDARAESGPESGPLSIGVVRTKKWKKGLGLTSDQGSEGPGASDPAEPSSSSLSGLSNSISHLKIVDDSNQELDMLDLALGSDTHGIARGLFSALRSLDEKGVSIIYVEGVSDTEGNLAAAVMNRLRKAAEEEVKG